MNVYLYFKFYDYSIASLAPPPKKRIFFEQQFKMDQQHEREKMGEMAKQQEMQLKAPTQRFANPIKMFIKKNVEGSHKGTV